MDRRSRREHGKQQSWQPGILHDCPFSEHKSERTAVQSFRAWRRFRSNVRVRVVPNWEESPHTRQFSYEWQTKDLKDTELGIVRKSMKIKSLLFQLCG